MDVDFDLRSAIMASYYEKAFAEYNSDTTTAHHGGVKGRSFWNMYSSQFIFNPAFLFPTIPGAFGYLFTATDCNGEKYTFKADSPTSLLTPIWADIPVGKVVLKVEALDKAGNPEHIAGVRTFFKAEGFKGRENYPERACSYKECALAAYKYVFSMPAVQYWLLHSLPDPEYYHNVYPSKTISSIVKAMIDYSKLAPADAADAIKLAKNAADYMLSITYGKDSAVEGLPPTYSFENLNAETVNKTAPAAWDRKDNIMLIYPASAGMAYLALEKATGDKKYLNAAKNIADYYKNNVQPNGSWYLFISVKTGQPVTENYCLPDKIMEFMHAMFVRTGETVWKNLEQGCFDYIKLKCLDSYNWEGQFEDSSFSSNYSNLTHFGAGNLIKQIAVSMKDNPELAAEAEDLMRFIEDQFVIWGDFAPWPFNFEVSDTPKWFSPAGLEQYAWYVPIDSSTSSIMMDFLYMYSINKKSLLLEKACVLGDMITRMQNRKTGVIPTHWMTENCSEKLWNFWINCHIATAGYMMRLAEVMGEI